MNSAEREPAQLARFVAIRPDPSRIDRMWQHVEPRLERRLAWPPLARWALATAVVVLAVISGRALAPDAGPDPSWRGATFESAGGSQLVRLSEGTAVELAGPTRAELVTWTPERAELVLERGEVTLDVAHGAGRAWAVVAGPYRVRVVGTRFRVRRESGEGGDRVAVEVLRGRVEVVSERTPDDVRALGAGEKWESTGAVAAAPAPSAAPAAGTSAGEPGAPPAASEAAPAPGTAPGTTPAAPGWEDLMKARKHGEAWNALGGSQGFEATARGASAKRLYELAQLAIATGHLRDAAKALDALRKGHRGDPRAGLAAFELGRLRQDSFGDAAGAAEALADAIALGGPFREDAEARRVHALHASGSAAACATARDAYLTRYPNGAHAAAVRARCGGR